jgi:hypothetical protein
MIKEIDKFQLERAKEDYFRLEHLIQWGFNEQKGRQASVQYKEGDDIWRGSVDRSKGNEFEYNILNPVFKNSIFEELILKYRLKRSRLLWLHQWSCYSLHRDWTPRIHFPIITNPQCFLIFKNGEVEHLKEGIVYYTDTRFFHTAMNGSEQMRLHFVGVTDVIDINYSKRNNAVDTETK